ncbi:hypothetical protein Taro_034387 [Colocasia esculenta]|uniref:Uncharacterized protein n=1 Tax=Colocasia esculenta TaxID=4460 RepID=A0A843W0N6_COLES|nr:hypothetical protein [Colocasia esculenta]
MCSGARWAARQFVPLDGGVRGLGRLQPRREPGNLLGTLWEYYPSRVVPRSGVTVLARKPFIVVRYGKTGDLLGGMPQRNLTASVHGGRTMEVFEPPWGGRGLRRWCHVC